MIATAASCECLVRTVTVCMPPQVQPPAAIFDRPEVDTKAACVPEHNAFTNVRTRRCVRRLTRLDADLSLVVVDSAGNHCKPSFDTPSSGSNLQPKTVILCDQCTSLRLYLECIQTECPVFTMTAVGVPIPWCTCVCWLTAALGAQPSTVCWRADSRCNRTVQWY